MKNILTTIPKSRFKSWSEAEEELRMSDGEAGGFWTAATNFLPRETIGALCFMIFDGKVRGYMTIVNTDLASNWQFHIGGKAQYVLVMANWHPIAETIDMTGFQGWRYTPLRP